MVHSLYDEGETGCLAPAGDERVLEDLLRKAPKDHFTLGWVMSTLHQRSFGVIILFLAFSRLRP